MEETFHNYGRKLQRRRETLLKSGFSNENKQAILDFSDYCFSEGLSVPRVEKYFGHMKCLAGFLEKDFSKADRSDLEQLVRTIELSNYSDWTKRDLRITIKKFYRWLRETDEDPPETRWIKLGGHKCTRKLPEELLSEEDISRLIDACNTSRDRAFISVLYESGCRIGEIASLRMKHVVPYTHGFRLIVSGKTGTRRLLVISSASYLTEWLNVHPHKSDPRAYLWITQDYRAKQLSYGRMIAILKRTARCARISKNIHPHIFRHSRATYLANHFTEAQMNEFFGWTQGSNMPSVYVHLSGRNIDNALLETYGIADKAQESSKSQFKPITCPRCSDKNAPTNKFCFRCGSVLNQQIASQLIKTSMGRKQTDTIMNRLVEDKEFLGMLQRKLNEIAIKTDTTNDTD